MEPWKFRKSEPGVHDSMERFAKQKASTGNIIIIRSALSITQSIVIVSGKELTCGTKIATLKYCDINA